LFYYDPDSVEGFDSSLLPSASVAVLAYPWSGSSSESVYFLIDLFLVVVVVLVDVTVLVDLLSAVA
jgi:hypothetical protein